MRSLFILFLLILLTFTSATSHDTSFSYPNLHVTDASQHSLFAIFKDPSLIQDDTKNLTSIFNLTCTMATHIPQAQEELEKGSGPFTFWLPDDQGLFQAKPWWEKQIQQDNNFTDVDLGKTWNGTETNETIKKVVMNYTHAGLMWSGMKGNITLSSLQEENLLTTCLNDTQFVALGKNETTGSNAYQMMRVVKGDSLSIYGENMTMDHSNRTNVMVVSGSGMKEWQIAHVYRAIIAKNGVVYILDRAVSFPQNTTKMLKKENATLFLKGIDKADLNSTINNTPNVTIFVPTDEAIERVMREYGVPDETKRKYTKENMRDILKPYIIKGAFYAQDFNSSTPPTLESMSGQTHPVSRGPSGEVLLYGNVSVIAPNILTRNGVVHMINDTFRELEQEIVKKLPKTQARRFRRFF